MDEEERCFRLRKALETILDYDPAKEGVPFTDFVLQVAGRAIGEDDRCQSTKQQ